MSTLFVILSDHSILGQVYGRSMLANRPIFGECSIINPTFIDLEETSCYCSVPFFSAFHWLSSIGKPRMTLVSFVEITESYEVSLVTRIGKPRVTPVFFAKTTESYKAG